MSASMHFHIELDKVRVERKASEYDSARGWICIYSEKDLGESFSIHGTTTELDHFIDRLEALRT